MAVAILAAALAGLGGLLATYGYDDDAGLVDRVVAGLVGGFALLAGGALAGSLVAGMDGALVMGLTVAGAPIAGLGRSATRHRLVADAKAAAGRLARIPAGGGRLALSEAAWAVAMLVLLVLVFERVMIVRDGTILTGYVSNLGDLPFHLQVMTSFSAGDNFPPVDPGYAGSTFSYPYLADLVAAVLVRLGASLQGALFIQNLVLGVALVGLLHRLTRLLTGDRLAAAIAPVLLLLSGGLGFVTLLDDARRGEEGLLAVLGSLSHDVTILGDGPYRWGNAITTLLVTQRGLLFAIPVGLLVLILAWKLATTPPAPRARRLRLGLAAGALAGVLPLVNLHAFVVVVGTLGLLALAFAQWRGRRWEPWLVAIGLAVVLALPALLSTSIGSRADLTSFLGISIGWDRGDLDPISFWLLNTGLFIPLAVAGLYVHGRGVLAGLVPRPDLVRFSVVFLTWFLVPNVLRLAPWLWDNNKVLVWWFIGFIPVVALLLAALLRRPGALRAAGAAAVVVLVLAGSIDVWRALSRQTEYVEFDRDAVAIAGRIEELTPPDSVILHVPTWNTPVYLTGRRSVLGYPGHIWSRGLAYAERQHEIEQIYAGATDRAALLARYGVGYVLVGRLERDQLTVDEQALASMTLIAEVGAERLYEVTPK